MDINELTHKALVRGVPAEQWLRLGQRGASTGSAGRDALERDVLDALLGPLTTLDPPPALLLEYLRAAVEAGIISPRAVLFDLLRALRRDAASQGSPSKTGIEAVCGVLRDAGGEGAWADLPARLGPAHNGEETDVQDTTSTDTLLDALLDLMGLLGPSDGPAADLLAGIIRQSPALRHDVPEQTARRIEAFLQDDTIADDLQDALKQILPGRDGEARKPPPTISRAEPGDRGSPNPLAGEDKTMRAIPDAFAAGSTIAPETFASEAQQGVPAHILLALKSALKTGWYTSPPPSTTDIAAGQPIPEVFKQLVRLGPVLSSRAETFLHYLVQASLEALLASEERASGVAGEADAEGGQARDDFLLGIDRTGINEVLWVISGLWALLSWWAGSGDEGERGEWTYPNSLSQSLQIILPPLQERITLYDTRMQSRFVRLTDESGMGASAADGMDVDLGFDFSAFGSSETTPVSAPDPLLALIGQGLSRHGLLSGDALAEMGLPVQVTEETASLSDCLAADKGQQQAIVLKAINSPGFAGRNHGEIYEALANLAAAPDGLIAFLLEQPAMLDLLCASRSPASLYQLLMSSWSACSEVGHGGEDPQVLLARCGGLVNLIETVCTVHELSLPPAIAAGKKVYPLDMLSETEQECLAGWIKALFGSGGIDDEILQATTPAALLKLAATIVTQACFAVQDGVISGDVLRGGLSYFAQPLLSWCTGVVVDCLCADIMRHGSQALCQLEALSVLVSSESLQRPALAIRFETVREAVESGLQQDLVQDGTIDLSPMQAILTGGPEAVDTIPTVHEIGASVSELQNPMDAITLVSACDTIAQAYERGNANAVLNALENQGHLMQWPQKLRRLCAALLLLQGPSCDDALRTQLIKRLARRRPQAWPSSADDAMKFLLAAMARTGQEQTAERIVQDLAIESQRRRLSRPLASSGASSDPLLKDDFLREHFSFGAAIPASIT